MNVGALDLGSNSFGMLVGRVRGRRVEKLSTQKVSLRIGDTVARYGALPEPVFERALEVVRDLADKALEAGAVCLAAVGTSALRDARNGGDFVRAAGERFGLAVELASGEEEGRLVYRGALSSLESTRERSLVMDLGGGSVELAVGDGDECLAVESLPLGFLRVARELELASPLNGADVARVAAYVRRTAEPALRRLSALEPHAFVLCGGTARTLGRVANTLGAPPLGSVGLRRLATHLSGRDPNHLAVLGVDASRAPVFGVGLVVLATVAELLGAGSLRVSRGGLREGIVLRETRERRLGARATRTWAA
jgi:exopolyphosphatase/guanosine-5'-triphosphate,3'-diphosphate pyrophosphatase